MAITFDSYESLMEFVHAHSSVRETESALISSIEKAFEVTQELKRMKENQAYHETDQSLYARIDSLQYQLTNANQDRDTYLAILQSVFSEMSQGEKEEFLMKHAGMNKIANIKLYRQLAGVGLKESKDFVERYLAR